MRTLVIGPTDILSSPNQSTGGIVSHTRLIIDALKGKTRLTVITFDKVHEVFCRRIDGVCYVIIPRITICNAPRLMFQAAFIIRYVLQKQSYNHTIIQAISYYLLLFPKPHLHNVFVFMHGIMFREYNPLLNHEGTNIKAWIKWFTVSILEKISQKRFEKFILINNEMGRFFRSKKCYLLRNQPAPQHRNNVGVMKEPIILCVGNLIPRKRQHLLIDEYLKCHAPDWRLIIIGQGAGSYRAKIEAMAAPHTNVIVRSSVSDTELSNLFAKAQVFCLPSSSESSPISILEAIKSGCKILATNVGGIPEIKDQSHAPEHFHLFNRPEELREILKLLITEPVQPVNHQLEIPEYAPALWEILNDVKKAD